MYCNNGWYDISCHISYVREGCPAMCKICTPGMIMTMLSAVVLNHGYMLESELLTHISWSFKWFISSDSSALFWLFTCQIYSFTQACGQLSYSYHTVWYKIQHFALYLHLFGSVKYIKTDCSDDMSKWQLLTAEWPVLWPIIGPSDIHSHAFEVLRSLGLLLNDAFSVFLKRQWQ